MFRVTSTKVKCSYKCYNKEDEIYKPLSSPKQYYRHPLNSKDFFRSALKLFPSEIIEIFPPQLPANSSALNQPILVFLSCPQVSGNRQKPKRNYIAFDGDTENFQGLESF